MAQLAASAARPESAGVDLGMSAKSLHDTRTRSLATVDLSQLGSSTHAPSAVNASAPASPARHRPATGLSSPRSSPKGVTFAPPRHRPVSAPVPPHAVTFRRPATANTTTRGRSAQSDRSSVSPTRDRVGALGTRISALQMGIEDEKLARREAWEAQLKKLGDRLHVVANSDVALFAAWIDKVAALRESVASEKTTRSRQAEAGLKAIRAVDSSLSEQFAAHSIKRKALFARVQDSLVEPERRVTSTVETFNAERERGEAHRMQVTRSELAKLHADIATLKPQREEEEAAVAATLAAEVARLQARLDAERALREKGERHMRLNLNGIVEGLRTTMAEQKLQRETMEETLLELLEDVTQKVEMGIANAQP